METQDLSFCPVTLQPAKKSSAHYYYLKFNQSYFTHQMNFIFGSPQCLNSQNLTVKKTTCLFVDCLTSWVAASLVKSKPLFALSKCHKLAKPLFSFYWKCIYLVIITIKFTDLAQAYPSIAFVNQNQNHYFPYLAPNSLYQDFQNWDHLLWSRKISHFI